MLFLFQRISLTGVEIVEFEKVAFLIQFVLMTVQECKDRLEFG